MREKLFTPGPVEIPERILHSLSDPVIHHRTDEHKERLKKVVEGVRQLVMTGEGDVAILSSSGTGGMEAVVSSLVKGFGKALVVDAGKFGKRWAELCEVFEVPSETLFVERGSPVDPEAILEAVGKDAEIRAVLMTLTETSTGVVHDVKAIGSGLAQWEGLLGVDAISGLVADELRMDEWGVDVCVTGSQKGLMLPPGLGFVVMGSKAKAVLDGRKRSKGSGCYYLDLKKYVASFQKGFDVPFTPAISLIRALEESLEMILDEGMESVWARHARMAQAVRNGCIAMGMKLLATARPSNALTAAFPPTGVDAVDLVATLKKEKGIRIAGGQDELKGKIVRLAHLGACYEEDVLGLIGATETCLLHLGASVEPGSGVAAASASLSQD